MQRNTNAQRTLIIEPNADGHRLYYVQLLVESALERGDLVILVTRGSTLVRPEFNLNVGKWIEAIEVVSAEIFTVAAIAQLAWQHNADVTVVPDGDAFTYSLGRMRKWHGPGRVSVLLMRESVSPSRIPGIRLLKVAIKGLLIRRANRLRNVRVTVLKSAFWRGRSLAPTVNDPVSLDVTPHEVHALRTDLGLASDRYWFAIVGAVSQRKNPVMVLEALASCVSSGLGIVVAGKVDAEIQAQLNVAANDAQSSGHNVVMVNRLLDSRELDAIVAAVDCVVLAHSNEGPSGILGKAAAAGTRIVAAGALSLEKDAMSCPDLMSWHRLEKSSLKDAFFLASRLPRPLSRAALTATDFAEALL